MIAVYGANGHTGRFVAQELRRRAIPLRPLSRREASCDDPDSLDRALAGASAVINCAGPFADTAAAVAESALRVGIHYLDITAEQRSALQTFETYRAMARERAVAILPAMAFYGGLADLLATELTAGMRHVEDICVAVALDRWHPTQGTRATGQRNTARRWIVEEGRLAPLPETATVANWEFPEAFGTQRVAPVPLTEIVSISRHVAARSIMSVMNERPLEDLRDSKAPLPQAVDASGRSAQRFVMEVVAAADGERRRIAASGQDIYAVSAPIVVEACLRIVANPPAGGTYAPGELFDPGDFLAALAPAVVVSRGG